VRINVSLTEEGMAILDEERQTMGLSRSAFFEVLLRFWVRGDQRPIPQDRAAAGVTAPEEPPRRKPGKTSR
jgi:hypothetical protein